MKSEKGVSLVSLIIYLIAMTIAVGIVARISNYFYRNINILDTSLTSSEEFLNFNAYITKEVNIKGNEVQTIGEREISSGRMKYLIFSKTGNQYGFINNEICSNLKLEEIEYKNKILAITLYLQGNTTYMTNAYSVIK